jgi:hypothetical protein
VARVRVVLRAGQEPVLEPDAARARAVLRAGTAILVSRYWYPGLCKLPVSILYQYRDPLSFLNYFMTGSHPLVRKSLL